MGFRPTNDVSTMSVLIGTVGFGAMAPGSSSLSVNWPVVGGVSVPTFSPADVGRIVTVLGAGPSAGILIAHVATYVDSQHVTLDVSASADVSTDDANVTIFRPCVVMDGTLAHDQSLSSGETAGFTVKSADGSFVPTVGQPVLFTSTDSALGDTYGVFFGGSIASAAASNHPGSSLVTTDCQCVSWESLLIKRVMMAKQWAGVDAGSIISDICAGATGDCIGSSVVSGPTVTSYTVSDLTTYKDALDQLCQLVSTATDTYYVKVDPWRVVHFALQSTVSAPWTIDVSTGSASNALAQITATSSLEKYANHGYTKASKELQPAVLETYYGDGTKREFSASQAIELMPAIFRNGSPDLSVGVDGIAAPGSCHWYYTPGSSQIKQDPSQTVLSKTEWVSIYFQPTAPRISTYQYDAAVTERTQTGGGSGYYEMVAPLDTAATQDDADLLAQSVATRFGVVPTTVDIDTFRPGLRAGQLLSLDLPSVRAVGGFLISSVSMTVESHVPRWKIQAVDGSLIGDWRTALRDALNGPGGGTSGSAVTQGQPPALFGITPISAAPGAVVSVTLSGSGFTPDATVQTDSSGISVSSVVVSSATTITATFAVSSSAPAGAANVTAAQASGISAAVSFSIIGGGVGGATMTVTYALPVGALGAPYTGTVTASGGTAPYTYAITSGSLPTGLSLDASTGVISGTPSAVGGFTAVITATDSAAHTASVSCPITITSAVAPAPNVTATGSVSSYRPWAHATVPVFSGTITLPSSLGMLSVIEVYAVSPSGEPTQIDRIDSGLTPSGTAAFSGWSGEIQQTGSTQTGWGLKFVCYNNQGTPTTSPYSIGSLTIAAYALSYLSGTDNTAARWANADRSVFAPQTVAITSSSPVTMTLWIYDGARNNWQGWYAISGASTLNIGLNGGKEIIYAPPVSSTWTLKTAIGAWEGNDTDGWRCTDLGLGPVAIGSIPGLISSAGYTVAGMAKPLATEITGLALPTPASGAFPYDVGTGPNGEQAWGWASMVTTGAPGINTKSYTMTMQDYGRVGGALVPIGVEHKYGDMVGVGDWGGVEGPYGAVATPPRNLTGSLVAIEAVGIRIYGCSRKNDTADAWKDSTTSTLQTSIGVAGILLVTVAVSGAVPSGAIPTQRFDPTTFGTNLGFDASGNLAGLNAQGANLLSNPGFEQALLGWTASGAGGGTPYVTAAQSHNPGGRSLTFAAPPTLGQWIKAAQSFTDVHPGDVIAGKIFVLGDAGNHIQCVYIATWYDRTGGWLRQDNFVGVNDIPTVWTQLSGVTPAAPAGASRCDISIFAQPYVSGGTGNIYIDDASAKVAPGTGVGTTLDAAGNVVVKPGGSIAFDGSGNVVVSAGPGLTFDAGGALVPNQGATVGVNASGQLVVPQSSLGAAQFSGYGATSGVQPYAMYFGLPSPYDSTIPRMIINTADWKVYRNTGGAWTKAADPADIVAGTITALVSLISPAISGGSIVGTSISITGGGVTCTISPTAFSGGAGMAMVGGGSSMNMSVNGIQFVSGSNAVQITNGYILLLDGTHSKLITAAN